MSISVTVFVAVDFFSVSLTTNPCYPQHLEFICFGALIVKHLLRHRDGFVFP